MRERCIGFFKKNGTAFLMYQTGYISLTDTQSAPMFSGIFSSGNLPQFFNVLFQTAISVGAILAVLRIAYAGWLYMSTDAFGQKSNAKETIQDAILGLVLLLGIYIILNQINPEILNLDVLRNIQK